MKQIVMLGILAVTISACSNMPGQQLYTCTDNYASIPQSPPAASVPAPSAAPYGWCPCQAPVNSAENQQPQQPVQPTPPPPPVQAPAPQMCPVHPSTSTCPPTYVPAPVCPPPPPCQCQIPQMAPTSTVPTPVAPVPAHNCRFDPMQVSPGMNSTEILNRTR